MPNFRETLLPTDREAIRRLVDATGFFSREEVEIAVELVDERLLKGESSGYHFLIAEVEGRVSAYACFGPIPGTKCSFDLYWIVVAPEGRRRGIGREVLARSEARMAERGAGRIYAETSGRTQYAPTRAFYEACGYAPAAFLEDFYAPGDGKVVYVKEIAKDSR
jgi:GNAT superfamily N-acetyltransferase